LSARLLEKIALLESINPSNSYAGFVKLERLRDLAIAAGPATTRRGRPPGIPTNGNAVKRYRGALSQEDFAAKCAVSVDTIQRAEKNGSLSETKLCAIAIGISKHTGHHITSEDLKKPQK